MGVWECWISEDDANSKGNTMSLVQQGIQTARNKNTGIMIKVGQAICDNVRGASLTLNTASNTSPPSVPSKV